MNAPPAPTLQILAEIEDRLFPGLALDVWERTTYYHLLRLTLGTETNTVQIALSSAGRATAMSEDKIRRTIRSMAAKGCIRIEDRGKNGHLVRLLLPHEIERLRASPSGAAAAPRSLDEIDFYEERRYLGAILRRDQSACFYCGRHVTVDTVALDHVVSVVHGGGNSHRNIVATCHECNSVKQASAADEYMRLLYRKGVLSQVDLTQRLARLAQLQAGELSIVLDPAE